MPDAERCAVTFRASRVNSDEILETRRATGSEWRLEKDLVGTTLNLHFEFRVEMVTTYAVNEGLEILWHSLKRIIVRAVDVSAAILGGLASMLVCV